MSFLDALNTVALLETWEACLDLPVFERGLRLLAGAHPGSSRADLGLISIGERDARLLRLRERVFGKRLRNKAACPACDEVVEWESETTDLYLQPVPEALVATTGNLETEGYNISYRLPGTLDLIAAAAGEPSAPRQVLMGCVTQVRKEGGDLSPSALPDSVWDALEEQMAAEDPQADIRIRLTCPVCSHGWEVRFDIVSFFWTELNSMAQRLLQEVGLLARSFGWSEKDILAMSPRRRQFYLQMIAS